MRKIRPVWRARNRRRRAGRLLPFFERLLEERRHDAWIEAAVFMPGVLVTFWAPRSKTFWDESRK